LIFNFDLEFLKKLQSSEPLHKKMHQILLLVGITGCMVTNRNLFRGKPTISLWITACEIFEEILTSRNPNQKSATLLRIFSSNKRAPANRKKGFNTNRNPNKQEVGFNLI
jgi:hypothetical protein